MHALKGACPQLHQMLQCQSSTLDTSADTSQDHTMQCEQNGFGATLYLRVVFVGGVEGWAQEIAQAQMCLHAAQHG